MYDANATRLLNRPDILCPCHLQWEQTLFQRPQQIMSRLGRKHRVAFAGRIRFRSFIKSMMQGRSDKITGSIDRLIYRNIPNFPGEKYFSSLRRLAERRNVAWLQKQHHAWSGTTPILWIYHPNYVDYLDAFAGALVVYDCMDHFAGFRRANERAAVGEARLLEKADVVFTGGRSLQEAKEKLRPDARCFPSGVEFEHFSRAMSDSLEIPEDLGKISGKRLGYFGAVDERIDFELLQYICEKRPDWSIILIGPLVGLNECPIDAPNFYYLGAKPYARLPGYLKGFDACIMPFVKSELNAHISPTKTPEYLAGNKPVVSTSVPDVIRDYGEMVFIAEDRQSFVEKAEAALSCDINNWYDRLRSQSAARSWDETVKAMMAVVQEKWEA
ncbi:MAG: glycosyltransferase family 1 protein [Candidatus Sumerlaeia bacterium]